MWIYGNQQTNETFYRDFPYLPVTQLSYMPRPLPWRKYPHIHSGEYEFGFILSGRGSLYLPGAEYPLEEGSITLVSPGVAHYFVSAEKEDLEYFALRIAAAPEGGPALSLLEAMGCRAAKSRHFDDIRRLLGAAGRLAHEERSMITRPVQLVCLAVWDLAMKDLAESGQALSYSAPEYAYDILCYLQEHVQDKITLEDLAERFHLSASHISRVFSRTYHISPINYLIMSRMARARTYILEEQLPPAEIAKKLAYSDTWQFVNAFTRFFGCRPEDYYDFVKQHEE